MANTTTETKEAGMLEAFKAAGKLVTVLSVFEKFAKWSDGVITDLKVKIAFEINKSELAKAATVVDGLLDASGEEGALLGMYCLRDGISEIQLYPGPVVVGTGQSPQDAMDKYYLTEQKIDEPFPAAKLFAAGEGYENPKIGDECFGLWVEKGGGVGARKIELVPDMIKINAAANLSWITHKSNLLLKRNADAIVTLKKTNMRYQEMLEKFSEAALEKKVYGAIAGLIQENAKSQEKFLQAGNEVQKALDRAKKYQIYSEIGALLGVASSVVNLSTSLGDNAKTQGDYYKTVYEQTKMMVQKNQEGINQMFYESFQIQKANLPNPQPPELVKP